MPSTLASAPSSSGPVEAPVQTPDLKRLPRGMLGLDPRGERQRNGLGIARAGEAAHADGGAGGNEGCRLLRAHDLGAQFVQPIRMGIIDLLAVL